MARRRLNSGLQVVYIALDHLETDVRLIAEYELIAFTRATLATYFGDEGRAHNVLVGELHSDRVVARRRGIVDDVTRAILVVTTLYLGLGRSFHGHGETARARILGHNTDLARLLANAVRQSAAVRGHVARARGGLIACERINGVHVELERRALYGLTVVEHVQFVEAHLARLILDGHGAVRILLHARIRHFTARHFDACTHWFD